MGGFLHDFCVKAKAALFFHRHPGFAVWYDGVVAVSSMMRIGFAPSESEVSSASKTESTFQNFPRPVPDPVKSMLWIGRFSHNKRLDRLISFFGTLLKVDPQWRLTIAGQPWDFGVSELRSCPYGAHRERVPHQIAPSDAEIKNMIGANSVIVSTSDYEGFGIAAIEGMSAGLFPLLSEIAPYKQLVARSGVGLTVNFDRKDEAVAAFWKAGARSPKTTLRSGRGRWLRLPAMAGGM